MQKATVFVSALKICSTCRPWVIKQKLLKLLASMEKNRRVAFFPEICNNWNSFWLDSKLRKLLRFNLPLSLLLSALASADTLPGPLEYTAKKNGLYAVQDSTGAIISEHITEREALQNASNLAITKKSNYTVTHNYTVPIVYKSDSVFLSFQWLPPQTRKSGEALKESEVAYYAIYGKSGGAEFEKLFIVSVAKNLVARVPDYYEYFAVSAIDKNGLESEKSTVAGVRK